MACDGDRLRVVGATAGEGAEQEAQQGGEESVVVVQGGGCGCLGLCLTGEAIEGRRSRGGEADVWVCMDKEGGLESGKKAGVED